MDSATVKHTVMQQVANEANLANVRALIDKLQENCFQRCITKPGGSISSSEQTCATNCIEKYMLAWNQVNSAYISRLRSEGSP